MTFEPDTGLLVNTQRGTVHKPDCEVVTRTNQRSGRWLAPWKGVAMKDDDKPCGYCKPDLDAARAVSKPLAPWDVPWTFTVTWDPAQGSLPLPIARLFRHRFTRTPGEMIHQTDRGHSTYYVTAVETFVQRYYPDRTDIKATAVEVPRG